MFRFYYVIGDLHRPYSTSRSTSEDIFLTQSSKFRKLIFCHKIASARSTFNLSIVVNNTPINHSTMNAPNNEQQHQGHNFREGDAVIVCGGQYNTKVGKITSLLAVKIRVKIRGDATSRTFYPRQLRVRTTNVERRYVFLPESVSNAAHAIAVGLYRAEYPDDESVAAVNHVIDLVRSEYAVLRESE